MSRAILGAFERKHVADDKLWELVEQANQLTEGDYEDWDNNAEALVPVLERILPLARERGDWQVYFAICRNCFGLFAEPKSINCIWLFR